MKCSFKLTMKRSHVDAMHSFVVNIIVVNF